MGLGVSIFLIAVGAILTWAVNATVSGLELQTIGVILMVVGALGLVLSMIFWSSWGGVGGGDSPDRPTSRTARASSSASFSASHPFEREAAPGPPLLVRLGDAAARTRTSSRCPAPTRPGSGRPSGARSRARCRARARCRRRRARGSGRGGRTSRRSARARRRGMPSPRSRTTKRTRPSVGSSSSSTRPPSGEYLTAFSTRLTSTWRSPSGSAATCGPGSGTQSTSSMPGGQVRLRGGEHARARARPASVRLISTVGGAGVEPAREQDVVDDPREPLRLAGDHVEHPGLLDVVQLDVVALQRHRGAVDRRERASAARARRSRRSRSSAARRHAPRSGRGTRRRCRAGTRRRSARARARRAARRPGTSAAVRPARAASRPGRVSAGAPTTSPSESPVIRAAAGFQSRTTPSRPTRKTPSPTNSSACAACAPRRSSPTRPALSIATPARPASSCARSRSCSSKRSGRRDPSVRMPRVSPAGDDRHEHQRACPDLLDRHALGAEALELVRSTRPGSCAAAAARSSLNTLARSVPDSSESANAGGSDSSIGCAAGSAATHATRASTPSRRQIDVARVRQPRHADMRDPRRDLVLVERGREELAGLREQAQTVVGPLAVGDLHDHRADPDHLALGRVHRVVAREPVAALAHLQRRVVGRLGVHDRLARLEHTPVERDEDGRELADDLPEVAADVLLGREPVDRRRARR